VLVFEIAADMVVKEKFSTTIICPYIVTKYVGSVEMLKYGLNRKVDECPLTTMHEPTTSTMHVTVL